MIVLKILAWMVNIVVILLAGLSLISGALCFGLLAIGGGVANILVLTRDELDGGWATTFWLGNAILVLNGLISLAVLLFGGSELPVGSIDWIVSLAFSLCMLGAGALTLTVKAGEL
jgi:hypothetical protein